MNNLDAASAVELCDQLRANDVRVPPRTEGRTTSHVETRTTCRFLATICRANFLEFPLRVESGDRPDLVLTMPLGKTGIEISEAVPTDKARVDAYARHKGIDGFRFIPRYRITDAPRSRAEIEKIAKGQSRSQNLPLMGDSIEYDRVDAIHHLVSRKSEKFTKPGFATYPNNWLLIYDNWGVLDEARVPMQRLAQKISEHAPRVPFDKVFVLRPLNIWEFRVNSAVVVKHAIPESWRDTWHGASATLDDP